MYHVDLEQFTTTEARNIDILFPGCGLRRTSKNINFFNGRINYTKIGKHLCSVDFHCKLRNNKYVFKIMVFIIRRILDILEK